MTLCGVLCEKNIKKITRRTTQRVILLNNFQPSGLKFWFPALFVFAAPELIDLAVGIQDTAADGVDIE